jgi:hypothetical protein
MFKFFLKRCREPSPDDPLAHPAIQAMSLDEIADLPLTPQWPHGSRRTFTPSWCLAERKL